MARVRHAATILLAIMALFSGANAALPLSSTLVLYALHAQAVWSALKANRFKGKPLCDEDQIVAFASHTIMTHMFPQWAFRHDALLKAQFGSLHTQDYASARTIGVNEASKVAAEHLWDNYQEWDNYTPYPQNKTESIGKYQFTPGQTWALLPRLGWSRPFVLRRSDVDTIADKYIKKFDGYFGSDQWYKDLDEVRTVGSKNSSMRSQYDTDTAIFWAGFTGTSLDHGQFINISIAVLPAKMTLYEQARYFAMLASAINDAYTTCHKVKYSVLFWRPVTAIQYGDNTGRYTPDPNWQPLISTPPHPSYPAAHQCLAASASKVIIKALGGKTKVEPFNVTSDSYPGYARTYTDINKLVEEVVISRVCAGVHYRNDNENGLGVGWEVADLVMQKFT